MAVAVATDRCCEALRSDNTQLGGIQGSGHAFEMLSVLQSCCETEI